jgi:hypothetical protein
MSRKGHTLMQALVCVLVGFCFYFSASPATPIISCRQRTFWMGIIWDRRAGKK